MMKSLSVAMLGGLLCHMLFDYSLEFWCKSVMSYYAKDIYAYGGKTP